MSKIKAFLTKHFPPNKHIPAKTTKNTPEDWNDSDLIKKFFKDFGTNTWVEGSFYGFKYETCVVHDWDDIVDECRGTIVYRTQDTWEICASPFTKFFNQNEPECPYQSESVFNATIPEFTLVEKADGTCIQLWYCDEDIIRKNFEEWKKITEATKLREEDIIDLEQESEIKNPKAERHWTQPSRSDEEKRENFYNRKLIKEVVRKKDKYKELRIPVHKNGWRVSTLGRITPSTSMEALFWKFFPKDIKLDNILNKENTYLFELCCKENKIVTVYDPERLYLLASKNNKTGQAMQLEQVDTCAEMLISDGVNIHRPVSCTLAQIGIKSLNETKAWIDEQAIDEEKYGKFPEGFVLYKDGIPAGKMKNSFYFGYHQLLTGSILLLRNIAIERFFEGTIDDIYGILKEPIKEFVAELKVKTINYINDASVRVKALKQNIQSKLEDIPDDDKNKVKWRIYAQEVKKPEWKDLSGFLFKEKEKIMLDDDVDMAQLIFNSWLKTNYMTMKNHWKETKVKALLDEEEIQKKVKLNKTEPKV